MLVLLLLEEEEEEEEKVYNLYFSVGIRLLPGYFLIKRKINFCSSSCLLCAQLVMAVKCRGKDILGGLHTGINTEHITAASNMESSL